MKRVIVFALTPTAEQAHTLKTLQAVFAAACTFICCIALERGCYNRVRLHHLTYYRARAAFPTLGSQLVCNAIARVSRAFKHSWNGGVEPTFSPAASVHFDARSFTLNSYEVSLRTLSSRQRIGFKQGQFQANLLTSGTVREADLVRRRNRWFLNVTIEIAPPASCEAPRVLGLDLGENVLAATSNGTLYRGEQLRDRRDRYSALRARLQRNGSKSARRLLLRISGRESRHAKHINHEVSAAIVAEAVASGCGTIVLERLVNIRQRVAAAKRVRARLHRWAWRQLQKLIEYKAEANGIRVIYVNPAYTSRTCARCGGTGARSRHRFACKTCGIFAHSDRNAARNLARIGASALAPTGGVMRPHVAVS